MSREEIVVDLEGLIALVTDGHCLCDTEIRLILRAILVLLERDKGNCVLDIKLRAKNSKEDEIFKEISYNLKRKLV